MSKVFFGGMPTEIDVKKLREAFPEINEGDEIAHEQIEKLLNLDRNANRYRTVTEVWRKKLLNEGTDMGAVAGVGFRCLNPKERITRSVEGFQSGTRKQLRAVRRSALVRTDDPILGRKQDLLRRYGAAIANEANSMMREIEPPKPQQQMSRFPPQQ